jgi:hypothetical protein
MTLSTGNTLEDIILRILGTKPVLSAESLRLLASRGGRSYSRAAVYKVLGRLLDSGMVVRSGPRYSLSLTWVFDVLTLADQLSKTYFSDHYIRSLIPMAGKRMTWNFSDLIRCNEFWNQLLLALLKQSSARSVFAWVPYPWFVLLGDAREARLQEVFKMTGRYFYTSFGPCGSAQATVEGIYKHKNQIVSFAKSPFAEQKVTVSLSPDTAKRIQKIFSSSAKNPATVGRHLAALSGRSNAKVTLECNRARSSRRRALFADFFGVVQ